MSTNNSLCRKRTNSNYSPHAEGKIRTAIPVPEGKLGSVSNVSCYDPSADLATMLMNLAHAMDVQLQYVIHSLTPAQFAAKMRGFTDNLDTLFKTSAGLEQDIKKQLAGLRYG